MIVATPDRLASVRIVDVPRGRAILAGVIAAGALRELGLPEDAILIRHFADVGQDSGLNGFHRQREPGVIYVWGGLADAELADVVRHEVRHAADALAGRPVDEAGAAGFATRHAAWIARQMSWHRASAAIRSLDVTFGTASPALRAGDLTTWVATQRSRRRDYVRMVASALGLDQDQAERRFPAIPVGLLPEPSEP